MLQKKAYSCVDAFRIFPVWIFGLLFDYVWDDGFSNLSGVCRSIFFEKSGEAALDL